MDTLTFLNELYNNFYMIVSHAFVLLWFGVMVHFLKELINVKKSTGTAVTFHQYWIGNKYQSILCIIGALVGYVFLQQTNQLTAISAFGIGYMADSIPDLIGKRQLAKLDK